MALAQAVHDTLHVAAEAAYQAFLTVQQADFPLTCFQVDRHGRSQATTLRDELPLSASQRRAFMHAVPAGSVASFMLFSAGARFNDSTASRGLYLEFGRGPQELDGVVLLLPYATKASAGRFFAGMLRATDCPAASAALLDEIVQAFRAVLGSLGGREWMRALEYDKTGVPSQAEFEASSAPLPLRAATLDPASTQADCNNEINHYLDALVERYPFADGLAFRDALYQLELDFSVPSLLRIDDFLGQAAASLGMPESDFLDRRANLNFLHCLAAYCGKVIAKASASWVDWYTCDQWHRKYPRRARLAATPYPALVAEFNGGAEAAPFLPVELILGRLFRGETSQQFRTALTDLAATVQAGRPRQINDEMPLIQQMIDALPPLGMHYLDLARPDWIAGDTFEHWYDNYRTLFRGGRVVWGVTVQANYAIFEPGREDCLGQIMYDPHGIVPPEQLRQATSRFIKVKGCRLSDPRLSFFSDFLTEEHVSVFGLRMPYSISSDDICTSAIIYPRKHLQGERLCQPFYPLLIHDDVPGVAMILPRRFWTPGLLEMYDDLS
ncbi:hypothetical protein [Massilia rubra]|uniref:Uncharacterized protein n=1 Tax=Massilia rubra TaxID=2607910 RepID=A0ABX0LMH7_9BURK|nr:hypothetical protein [Massilia rubra]NHZ35540.1 hypothetical protein [Massilia rubra]